MELNKRNERFHTPKKRVRFDFPDTELQSTQVGQGCQLERRGDDIAQNLNTAKSSSERIISSEEIKIRWYDRSDLMGFRQEAINLAFSKLNKNNGDETSLPRGMESLSPIRRKHKTNTLRYILLAIRIGKDQNFVGKLCAKLGRWNKDIAIRDACLDYLQIYRPSFIQSVPPVMSKPPKIPFVPDSVAKQVVLSRSKINESSVQPLPSSKKRELGYACNKCPNGKTF